MRRLQVSIIGSASGDDELMNQARALGEAVVDHGWRIICGGLSGVMHAAAEGAHRSAHATGGDVIGLLPTHDPSTANPCIDIVIPTGMQVARNVLVVGAGDVVVAIGGGAGTLSEIALAWQLRKPIIALASTGGWASELAGRSLDKRRNDTILQADNVPDAISHVQRVSESLALVDPDRVNDVGF